MVANLTIIPVLETFVAFQVLKYVILKLVASLVTIEISGYKERCDARGMCCIYRLNSFVFIEMLI